MCFLYKGLNKNKSKALDAAEKMSQQLNIPYEIITQEEMDQRFSDAPFSDLTRQYRKAFYQS